MLLMRLQSAIAVIPAQVPDVPVVAIAALNQCAGEALLLLLFKETKTNT